MRKLISMVFLCTVLLGWSQVPQKINFQTVLHQTEGSIISNQSVKLIINIIANSENGDIVYREEHTVQSNQFGLVNLQIGTGTVLYGDWVNILWGQEDQYLMIELDTTGSGNDYEDMGVAQMLSVPYALQAAATETHFIWEEVGNDIFYLDGDVSIGQDSASQDMELATDLKIEVSSDQSDFASNDLIKIVMDADTAEPTINWTDENDVYKASISVQDFTTNPLTSSKRFLINTANNSDYRRSHFEVTYGEDIADVFIQNSRLIVENEFASGNMEQGTNNILWADNWVNNESKFAIGNKNWIEEGLYNDVAAETYTNGENNFLLLNAADELKRAQVIFRRGNAEWKIRNDESMLTFRRNDSKKVKIMPDGKVKLGSNDPQFKLDVYGDVNIPEGYAYLIAGVESEGKYAEYFESEESVKLGSPVGMNLQTGLVRNYQQGDVFVGIACEPTGFIANAENSKKENFILVGLEGLVEINQQKNHISNHQVYTNDGQRIGVLIGGKVLLN